jgi:hypothetical protein
MGALYRFFIMRRIRELHRKGLIPNRPLPQPEPTGRQGAASAFPLPPPSLHG